MLNKLEEESMKIVNMASLGGFLTGAALMLLIVLVWTTYWSMSPHSPAFGGSDTRCTIETLDHKEQPSKGIQCNFGVNYYGFSIVNGKWSQFSSRVDGNRLQVDVVEKPSLDGYLLDDFLVYIPGGIRYWVTTQDTPAYKKIAENARIAEQIALSPQK